MAWKTQQSALNYLKKKYGGGAFAVDHENYKRVGVRHGEETQYGTGNTWDEAIKDLERKMSK